MKMRNIYAVVGCLTMMSLGAIATSNIRSQARVEDLLRSQPQMEPPSFDPEQLAARNRRARKLLLLWRQRQRMDVASRVAPFLHDPDSSVRNSAVRVLSRLQGEREEHAAVSLLRPLQTQRGTNSIEPLTIKLAIGQIRSRNLRGQKRLDAFCQSVGLSWTEIVSLSQRLASLPPSRASASSGQRIQDELIDVLKEMGERGEDIEPFAKQLSLSPAQRVLLQSASWNPIKRIDFILTYLSRLDIVRDDELLGRDLAAENHPALVKELQKTFLFVKAHPETSGKRGVVPLLRTAIGTANPTLHQVIKSFEQDPKQNEIVRYYAKQSRLIMESKEAFPPLP